jgi:hypothetical protein
MVTQFECERCNKIYPIGNGTWISIGDGMKLHCDKCIEVTKGRPSFIKKLLQRK